MIRAIFFDLGSTLWDDYPSTLVYWATIRELLAGRGINVTADQFEAQAIKAIHSYSPSLTRAVVWHFVDGNRQAYEEVIRESVTRFLKVTSDREEFLRLNPLFPGIHQMLEPLAARFPLGVVSQNFNEAEHWMQLHRIDGYFKHVTISQRERLFKPDPRLFLKCCEALSIEPRNVMMVGDRLDNDIWPANRLRMTTVRVLADPYRVQQPRYHSDTPDYTIEPTTQLGEILAQLGAI
jgi:HAD superfamily hydrolase (TIGR01549 family)